MQINGSDENKRLATNDPADFMFEQRRKHIVAYQKVAVKLERNFVGTEAVPSLFLISANPFRYGSVFYCSAAESGAATRQKRLNTEQFLFSDHGSLAL